MNGLKYIRTRCNYSISELANMIGVTRQALNLWENGKKPIPAKRKQQLSSFFGIDEVYFDDIDENLKQELLEKAMYRTITDKKESYTYSNSNTDSQKGNCICFLGDSQTSLDEQLTEINKTKKEVLDNVDKAMQYFRKPQTIRDQINALNRGISIYGSINSIMNEMPNQKLLLRMPYYNELKSIIEAFLIAQNLRSKEEILETYSCYKDMPVYDYSDWISKLSDMFSNHWQETQDKLNKPVEIPSTPPTNDSNKSMADQNREFWKENPKMKEVSGLQFKLKEV